MARSPPSVTCPVTPPPISIQSDGREDALRVLRRGCTTCATKRMHYVCYEEDALRVLRMKSRGTGGTVRQAHWADRGSIPRLRRSSGHERHGSRSTDPRL